MSDLASRNGRGARGGNQTARRVVVAGYILACAMPPLGLLLGAGIALRLGKPDSRHGALIIAISIIAAVIWVVIISSGALKATNNSY